MHKRLTVLVALLMLATGAWAKVMDKAAVPLNQARSENPMTMAGNVLSPVPDKPVKGPGQDVSYLLNESFTNTTFPPTGWLVVNGLGAQVWSRYTTAYYSSPACASCRYDAHNMDWLITPRVGPIAAGDSLVFYYYGSSTYPDTLQLRISTGSTQNDTASYALVQRYFGTSAWVRCARPLDAYAGQQIYVGFYYGDWNNLRVEVDDIQIKRPSAHDLAITAYTPPPYIWAGTNRPYTMSPRVSNVGTNSESNFAVACSVRGPGSVLRYASSTTIAGPLAAGAYLDVTMPGAWTPTAVETDTIIFRVTLTGDQDATNDMGWLASAVGASAMANGPDAGYYYWIDNDTTGGPAYAWQNIQTTGTNVPFVTFDDEAQQVPIGFSFSFYGNTYSNIYVGTNGVLSFDNTITGYGAAIPNSAVPNNVIAPWWRDLDVEALGRVKYQVLGSAPNRTFVVSYDSVKSYGSVNTLGYFFQVLLKETSNDIVFQYRRVVNGYTSDCAADANAIGIENSTGTVGRGYLALAANRGNIVVPGRAIRFYSLPPAVNDVGVTAVTFPSAITLRGSPSVAPSCNVLNSGTGNQSSPFTVKCNIRGPLGQLRYTNTQTVASLNSGANANVTFSSWSPTIAEVVAVSCSTELAGDQVPSNDRMTVSSTITRGMYTGGPDGGYYCWIDCDTVGGPTYAWQDITTTGTPVTLASGTWDDGYGYVTIPWTFNYYGSPWTQVTVSANGYLTSDLAPSGYNPGSIPNSATPNGVIALWWQDMDCRDKTNSVMYQVLGSAPHRVLVISYDSVKVYGQTMGTGYAFQALLYEDSSRIVTQYRKVAQGAAGDYGVNAAIGQENGTGTTGLAYDVSNNHPGNALSVGRAIKYYRVPPNNDIAVTSITTPGANVSNRANTVPECNVANLGTLVQSGFAVRCSILGTGNALRYANVQTVPSLNPGASTPVTFGSWHPTVEEVVTVKFRVAADENTDNDTLNRSTTVSLARYTGGPDADNYYWIDCDTTGGPSYGWIDPSGGSQIIGSNQDDVTVGTSLPWTFYFHGSPYDAAQVGSNGGVFFGTSGTVGLSNYALPYSGGPDLPVLWDDLHTNTSGQVVGKVVGTAPNRQFAIIWDNVKYYGSTGADPISFEIVLNEADNSIVYQYADVYGNYPSRDFGLSATVGEQNASGSAWLQYLYGDGISATPAGNLLSAGRAIRFYYPVVHDAGTDAISQPVNGTTYAPGTQITPAATIHNYGNVTENIPVTFAFSGYSNLQTANGVAPGGTASPTFTPTTPAPGYYAMTATTSLPGDANGTNDVQTGGFLVLGQPVGLTPDGVLLNTPSVVLNWDDLDGTATYDVYVDNNPDFSSPEFSQTGLTVSGTTTSALADGHYYWHVRGWNNLFGPWSVTAEFILDATVPGQATLLTPTNHETGVALQPEFTWTEVTFDGKAGFGPTGGRNVLSPATSRKPGLTAAKGLTDATPVTYQIQVATDAGFGNIVVNQSGLTDETYTPGSPLAWNTQHYWHVKASDGAGNVGSWSSAFDFTTVMQSPDAPALLLPADGATNVAVAGNLTWSAAARATSYDVYLDVNNPPTVKIGDNVTTLTQPYSGLANSQTYHWKVVAKNAGGEASSVVRSFTTVIAAPAAPVLATPANLATGITIDGNLTWNTAARATAYDVYLDVVNPPVALLAGDVAGTLQAYTGLHSEQVYYWQVKSKNIGGTALSTVWSFTTESGLPGGWYPKPAVIGGTTVKDGGAMAYNADQGLVYEMKGNKTLEFNSYRPEDSTWTALAPIPAGTKSVKGGASMATGAGKVFVTKGNNTLEFYCYDIATSAWLPATKTVPVGGGKKVKSGGSMAFVHKTDGDFVYLLKGYGSEFYKYDVTNDSFVALADAPAGMKPKYDKGSWIVYDGAQYIYCCKAKYGVNGDEFYKYDVLAEAWSPAVLPEIPLVDPLMGKKRKLGDGSAAAFGHDALFALKGANNNTFWKYTPGEPAGSWAELETMPQVAQAGDRKKKVKSGGAIVYYPETKVFFAQKGNKGNQFWMYKPGTGFVFEARPTRDGVAAGSVTNVTLSVSVSPNPLATGYATLRYSLPKAGVLIMSVYDATGRLVVTRTLNTGRTGSAALDLHSLSAGVYLVKLSSDGFSTSQKLVVE